MHLSEGSSITQSAKPALELIYLAGLPHEQALKNLRASLLANPNYFGRITAKSFKAVLNIQEDTSFESIGSIVYNPRLEQLQATVNLNQRSGYSSESRRRGSEEYVRFYLSFDRGSSWRDQGLRSVNAYDSQDTKPLQFVVSVGIGPAQTFCFMRDLPLVRAILSWNAPPPQNSPDWTPVWGNVKDAQIQLEDLCEIDSSTLRN